MEKEKNNKKIKLIIIIGIILVIIIILSLFIMNIINDKKETDKNMEIINTNYNELSANVKEYNQIRTDLSGKLNNFIYEKYPEEHNSYIEILNRYNENIKKIDTNINNIDNLCNVIYKDISINKICNSYKDTYEKLINLYISDLNNYNNKIVSYNEYKGTDTSLFELIHKDYIDYNNDKEYEGKDVENEENKEQE